MFREELSNTEITVATKWEVVLLGLKVPGPSDYDPTTNFYWWYKIVLSIK